MGLTIGAESTCQVVCDREILALDTQPCSRIMRNLHEENITLHDTYSLRMDVWHRPGGL